LWQVVAGVQVLTAVEWVAVAQVVYYLALLLLLQEQHIL
jgi:hypothetical protein